MGITARVHEQMADFPREEWNSLGGSPQSPALDRDWLDLLETAGGLDAEHGWAPRHLALWRGSDLVAAAPLYLRDHSFGDFVFDFGFADAMERFGARWYPKLVGMVPATPTVAWRVLVRPGEDRAELESRWWDEALRLAERLGVVSLQANFTDPAWSGPEPAGDRATPDVGGLSAGLPPRTEPGPSPLPAGTRRWLHQHFLWTNPGHADFDGYLAGFDTNQRRNIRRERAALERAGLECRVVPGEEVPVSWFGLMGRLYDSTNRRFGPMAARFLAPGFFPQLLRVRHLLRFSASLRPGDELPVALGLLLERDGILLGRYWGEREHLDCQYFNVCYYTPIEEAIRQGWTSFDPGAGSTLKARRGFGSLPNYSLHRFLDPLADRLFAAYADELNRLAAGEIASLDAAVPRREA